VATTSDDEIAAAIIGELKPYAVKVLIEDYKPEWPTWYAAAKAAICGVLGPLVLRIEHTGSTAVPGLAAKSVIDMLLVVPDTSDEAAYVPALESVGYTLGSREPGWYEHRFLMRRVYEGAPYNVNLHVFSPELAAPRLSGYWFSATGCAPTTRTGRIMSEPNVSWLSTTGGTFSTTPTPRATSSRRSWREPCAGAVSLAACAVQSSSSRFPD